MERVVKIYASQLRRSKKPGAARKQFCRICLLLTVTIPGCRYTGETPRVLNPRPTIPIAAPPRSQGLWWRWFGSTALTANIQNISALHLSLRPRVYEFLPDREHWTRWQQRYLLPDGAAFSHDGAAAKRAIRLTVENEFALACLKRQTFDKQIEIASRKLRRLRKQAKKRQHWIEILTPLEQRATACRRLIKAITTVSDEPSIPKDTFFALPPPPKALSAQDLYQRPDMMEAFSTLQSAYRLTRLNAAVLLPPAPLDLSASAQTWIDTALPAVYFPVLDPKDRERLDITALSLSKARTQFLATLVLALKDLNCALRDYASLYRRADALPPQNASPTEQIAYRDRLLRAAEASIKLRAELGSDWSARYRRPDQ